ncbi:hypothetical protein Z949_1672 [Sulfitobacter guttiformis KCTC 32187]|nr:hypothetical protein Z949_1672 [Sulfitobacter guttiformis KCTC 32187]
MERNNPTGCCSAGFAPCKLLFDRIMMLKIACKGPRLSIMIRSA